MNISVNTTGIAITSKQLLGHVLDLEQGAPAEGGRGGPARRAGPGGGRPEGRERCRLRSCGGPWWVRSWRWLMWLSRGAAGAVCGLAGKGEEHLVEARLAEGELADGDARPAELGHRGGRLLAGRPAGAGGRDVAVSADRVGPVLDR